MSNGNGGHNGGFNPFRDNHGYFADGPGAGNANTKTAAPANATKLHENDGHTLVLVPGRSPKFQIWKDGELHHEELAGSDWRARQKALVQKIGGTVDATRPAGSNAVPSRVTRSGKLQPSLPPRVSQKRINELTDLFTEELAAQNVGVSHAAIRQLAAEKAYTLAHNTTEFNAVMASVKERQFNRQEGEWAASIEPDRYE